MSPAPVALVILDGMGLAPPGPGNAVSLAHLPVFDRLWETMPHTMLAASGADVGLPDGQMGNSEVGHLNLGAGRIVPQTLVRIGNAVADGSLASNPAFVAACDAALAGRGVLHLAGLVSDGGVALARRPPARARARGDGAQGARASRCTRSRTGATSRRTRRPTCSPRSSSSGATRRP